MEDKAKKALLICSVHALGDFPAFERAAFDTALADHEEATQLSAADHARIIEKTTILEMMQRFPNPGNKQKALVENYLEVLNDLIWSAPVEAHHSVQNALMAPQAYRRPTGFVSEYPLATTNLVRAAALRTNATKLGNIVVPSDASAIRPMAEGLEACARSLKVSHGAVEVIGARRCDYAASQSIGMSPRFIEEARQLDQSNQIEDKPV